MGLKSLADGLVERYRRAGKTPPILMYTDRDCCNASGSSKVNELFSNWDQLLVRLDIWHFIRRIGRSCSSESHPLYGTFMSCLSTCLFEWDEADYQLLARAKRGELIQAEGTNPSESAIWKATTREELARHCCRRT